LQFSSVNLKIDNAFKFLVQIAFKFCSPKVTSVIPEFKKGNWLDELAGLANSRKFPGGWAACLGAPTHHLSQSMFGGKLEDIGLESASVTYCNDFLPEALRNEVFEMISQEFSKEDRKMVTVKKKHKADDVKVDSDHCQRQKSVLNSITSHHR
jgi:hypothetical protein